VKELFEKNFKDPLAHISYYHITTFAMAPINQSSTAPHITNYK